MKFWSIHRRRSRFPLQGKKNDRWYWTGCSACFTAGTLEELAAALSRKSSSTLSLAARFAAKEAFGKAIGIGLRGITLKNILVVNNHNGKPAMRLFGNALEAFKRSGGERIHLSLTHERDNALAMVVIEGDPVDEEK